MDKELRDRYDALKEGFKFYNDEIHTACFALPNFVSKIVA